MDKISPISSRFTQLSAAYPDNKTIGLASWALEKLATNPNNSIAKRKLHQAFTNFRSGGVDHSFELADLLYPLDLEASAVSAGRT